MKTSEDGLIHLSIDELLSLRLQHLLSGLDHEAATERDVCGGMSYICGYTEWVSMTQPAVSLGWDWCIRPVFRGSALARVGEVRSNVCLVNEGGNAASWERNLEALAMVVDALPWKEMVPAVIKQHYN
ncbi:hypothetical protein GCM10007860_27620 [Chitiniphilus shinanonensis]|uniref:DUF4902 domain-containing protein n=1 Tax=Chitiniphilus shinanonensis TaxID=553088 RepID=A0ABQ6BUD6_9NEIS|nr:DUF4902 domain-containing protein [Chitiniphilus shinanonensis]GLS05605.1 hypothetical protein GCM10007860_27620 [Chitiniphilus shinanonensis]